MTVVTTRNGHNVLTQSRYVCRVSLVRVWKVVDAILEKCVWKGFIWTFSPYIQIIRNGDVQHTEILTDGGGTKSCDRSRTHTVCCRGQQIPLTRDHDVNGEGVIGSAGGVNMTTKWVNDLSNENKATRETSSHKWPLWLHRSAWWL